MNSRCVKSAAKGCAKASRPLRVLLVDDHAMLLEAMRRQFEADPAFKVTALAESLDAMWAVLESRRVDVVLLDIQLGRESGLDAIADIRDQWPKTRVIMISMFEQTIYRDRAFELGADAYVTKGARFEDLRALLLDERPIQADAEKDHIWPRPRSAAGVRLTLTPRELRVVKLLAEGYQVKEVADELGISLSSVGTYLRRAMDKAGLQSRAELFRYAAALGYQTVEMAE